MPYIKQDHRKYVDEEIDTLIAQAECIPGFDENRGGILNYIISRLGVGLLDQRNYGYAALSLIRSAMNDASDEWYRRMMVPYENEKIQKNGDVPGFTEYDVFPLGMIFKIEENGDVVNEEGKILGKVQTPLPFTLKD